MKLYFEKSRCKFTESVNGFFLEVEPFDEEIEFTGMNGNEYYLIDENEDGIGPAPTEAFVVKKPRAK